MILMRRLRFNSIWRRGLRRGDKLLLLVSSSVCTTLKQNEQIKIQSTYRMCVGVFYTGKIQGGQDRAFEF
jgi:hypothetical protein